MALMFYLALIAHLDGYREEYLKVGVTFATTVMMKIVVNRSGAKDHATMIELGGGFLTVSKVFELINKITRRGFDGIGVAGTGDKGKGLVADTLIKIMESLKDNLTLHE